MPLSEEELRLLDQMERALAAEDPKFVSALQGSRMGGSQRMRLIAAAAVFAVGIAMLLGGAVTRLYWLSILGFVVMLGSATFGLTIYRGHPSARESTRVADTPESLFDSGSSRRGFDVIQGGRAQRPASRAARRPKRQAGGSSGSFMQRMEQRWQQRRDRGI